MTTRRAKCKACNNYLVRNGRDQCGKQRYLCRVCGTSTHHFQEDTSALLFELFRQYVLFGLTYEVLAYQSGISVKTLQSTFVMYLEQPPPHPHPSPRSPAHPHVLLIDGLWFNRWFVLMLYRESGNLRILRISTGKRELKRNIVRDLQLLNAVGYTFNGVTTDGGKQILGAIQKVYPSLPHQICLAHMHRAVISCLGRHPKEVSVLFLKELADLVWHVRTKDEKQAWSDLVEWWIGAHTDYLNEKRTDDTGRSWYIHKNVRKACRLLDSIYAHSFIFLDYPHLPKTTNEIEAQFGHLGKRWLAHRGMKHTRWEHFMDWFVFFYNEQLEKK